MVTGSGNYQRELLNLLLFKDCFDYDRDYYGNDVGDTFAENPKACQKLCQDNPKCKYWTLKVEEDNVCLFKSAKTGTQVYEDAVSGPKYCTSTGTYWSQSFA